MLAGAVLMAVAGSLLVSRHIGMPAVMPAQRFLATVCLVWGAWEIRGLARLRAAAPAPGNTAAYPAQAPRWHAGMARAAATQRLASTWRRLRPLRPPWRSGRILRRRRDG
jgi:hypothetical protein